MKSDEREALLRVNALVTDLHAAMSEEKKGDAGSFPQPRLAALAAAIEQLSRDVAALSARIEAGGGQ